jgi:hypothetical protein
MASAQRRVDPGRVKSTAGEATNCGRVVLATNVDILLDNATVQYLRYRLRSGTVLRISDTSSLRSHLTRSANWRVSSSPSTFKLRRQMTAISLFLKKPWLTMSENVLAPDLIARSPRLRNLGLIGRDDTADLGALLLERLGDEWIRHAALKPKSARRHSLQIVRQLHICRTLGWRHHYHSAGTRRLAMGPPA